MAWTAEDRRRYAPTLQEMVRQGMIVRLAATIDAIDPPARVGRPRVWSTLTMLQALWHVARDDRAWRRPPSGAPPRQTLWSRLAGGRWRAVPDRVLTIPVARRRRAAGRKPRSSTRGASGPARNAVPAAWTPTRRSLPARQGGPVPLRGPDRPRCGRWAASACRWSARKAARPACAWCRPTCGTATPFAPWPPIAPRTPRSSRLGSIAASPALARPLSSRPTVSPPDWSGAAGRRGFRVEPRRWKVEPTFGRLQRYRRLRVDDGMSHRTSRHMIVLASVFMIGLRFERMLQS